MKADKAKVLKLLAEALELTNTQERDEFICAVGENDLELQEKLLSLLEAYDHETGGLRLGAKSQGGLGDETILATIRSTEASGTVIGRYRLLEQLGEGGMGTVWMADQLEPVQRLVALKVIRRGMDSGNVLARFEAERQALALMDHANIAKVFDAGTTPSGRPYFVMELVKGLPITTFCNEKRLSVRDRLDLFTPVCHAIQHAHQKGIIHRDIKPSNVLVALYDGKAISKVIDFGIAKATGQRLTQRTLFTELGALVGTPEYMSPEQAELNQFDIDTRSDIYSLGVLLYELLTGSTPITHEQFREAAFDEILRRIREDEPAKPSTRLTESKDLAVAIASQRNLQPEQSTKLLRGDLDCIVMKALEKDRTRRYDTPNMLALDLTRYLQDEPIVARPPSVAYKIQKFARRNKTVLVFGSTVVLLTAALLVSAVLLAREAKYIGLTIDSNPHGARIWHEGQILGSTPLDIRGLPPGEFTYALFLDRFQAVTNTATLASKRHIKDTTFLRPTDATLSTNVTELAGIGVQGLILGVQGLTLVEIDGTVEVARNGSADWLPAQLNMVLTEVDQLRTARKSRAVLRWDDLSTFRMGELTVLQLVARTNNNRSIKIDRGRIYFRPGTNSRSIHIQTPAGTARIEG